MAYRPYLRVFTGEAYYRWTDLMHVPYQRFTRPEALPPWCVASRLGQQGTSSKGGSSKDSTGR